MIDPCRVSAVVSENVLTVEAELEVPESWADFWQDAVLARPRLFPGRVDQTGTWRFHLQLAVPLGLAGGDPVLVTARYRATKVPHNLRGIYLGGQVAAVTRSPDTV